MTTTTEPRAELVLLEPRDRATLDAERAELLADVNARLPAAIASPSEYAAVADLELRVSQFLARVEPDFDKVCTSAYATWKAACNVRSLFVEPAKQLKARARALLGAYKDAEAKARRDEENRIAAAEFEREVEQRIRDVQALHRQGQPELAAVVQAQPIDVAPVVLPSAVPDVAGLSYRDDWTWEPVGGDTPGNRARALSMLVRPEFRGLVKLDDAGLTAFAKRNKNVSKVPGIRFFCRQIPVRK
jgi:GNAT superfamily N-acetyltransferase